MAHLRKVGEKMTGKVPMKDENREFRLEVIGEKQAVWKQKYRKLEGRLSRLFERLIVSKRM